MLRNKWINISVYHLCFILTLITNKCYFHFSTFQESIVVESSDDVESSNDTSTVQSVSLISSTTSNFKAPKAKIPGRKTIVPYFGNANHRDVIHKYVRPNAREVQPNLQGDLRNVLENNNQITVSTESLQQELARCSACYKAAQRYQHRMREKWDEAYRKQKYYANQLQRVRNKMRAARYRAQNNSDDMVPNTFSM